MNKRGVEAKTLITIIILVLSFSIILMFYFYLSPKAETAREACRNSVVLRGSTLGKQVVRLNCETQDVCIAKGDDCGARPIDETIKIQNKEEFLDELTDLMYGCWWQMGEGEIDYLPRADFTDKYCAICDRIYFSDNFKEDTELSVLPFRDLYGYMRGKSTPDGENNLLFEFYKTNTLEGVRDSFLENTEGVVDIYGLNYNFARGDNGYALVTSITKKGWGGTIVGALVGGVAGVAIVGFVGVTGGAGILVIGAVEAAGAVAGYGVQELFGGSEQATGGTGIIVEGPDDTKLMPPAIMINDADVMKDLECSDFSSLA